MVRLPYMKIHPSEFRVDFLHMTNSELGAYLKLLLAMWDSPRGDCALEDDDVKLRRITGSDEAEWDIIKDNVLGMFHCEEDDDGNSIIFNEHLRDQFQHAMQSRLNRMKIGRQGADKRWGSRA